MAMCISASSGTGDADADSWEQAGKGRMTTAEAEAPVPRPLEADLHLLPTKLARPRVPPMYVPRPLVNELLDAGTRRPMTVVSAGPGWGKTLATAAWAARGRGGRPVAWVSLDEGDNEPRTFWSYFVAAVRGALSVPPSNPLSQIVPGLRDEDQFHRRLLTGMSQLQAPVTVVLDDFHCIREPAVLSGVTELLRHRVDQLRLVVLTRSDPTLPLHRLRVEGDLAEIRARELGFDVPDASLLLEEHGLRVSTDDVRLLVDRTEGWPAGMRLASLFLARRESPRSAADFAGDDQTVTSYLAEEVLDSQPPDVRRFLLYTSITDRLSSELADELTGRGGSQHYLETLESSNAFVVGLGPGRQWFRYHALLREMLLHRLTVEQPEAVPDLHRRAAGWFAENGYAIQALRHAADAGDWALVGRLVVTQAFPLLVSVDREALYQVLDRIPTTRLADGPELAMCAAARLYFLGQYQDIQPYLESAAARLDEASPEARAGVVLSGLIGSVAVARAAGDIPTMMNSASEALDLVSAGASALPAGPVCRAIALGNLGLGLLWSGRLRAALAPLEEGLAAIAGAPFELTKVNFLSHLGLVSVESGRLASGVGYATKAIELVEARAWGLPMQVATAYLALAVVHVQRNNIAQARLLLAQGREASVRERPSHLALGLAQVRLDAGQGRVGSARALLLRLEEEAADWQLPTFLARWWSITEAELDLAAGDPAAAAARIGPGVDREPPFVTERVCLARALFAGGDAQAADDVLRALRTAEIDESVQGGERVEMWLLTALAADALREDNRAVEAMRQAVAVAQPEGIRRPFVVWDGDRVRRILSRSREVDPGLSDLVDDVTSYLSAVSSDVPSGDLTAPLTDRELMILRFLPTMMTNTEIASELYVSVNTVKAHLKHIYRKLDVDTRRQAVHRARELGLL
jgi:LuxR family maltose regulon positive regulatory protein